MSYYVPDFGGEEDDPFSLIPKSSAAVSMTPSSATLSCSAPIASMGIRPPRSLVEDELSEIVWQNDKGPVLQRVSPRLVNYDALNFDHDAAAAAASKLFMEEDEMASWLRYSPDYVGDTFAVRAAPAANAPATDPATSTWTESAVVYSSVTTALPTEAGSDGGSGGERVASEDRKRKAPAKSYDSDAPSEGAGDDSDGKRKGPRRPRRTRSAEVHNLSERRRRDRINEKMKALRELIPRCNKTDKASMLDDVIEYTKSLQLQLQMMSMGCSIFPMMYPGMQQYVRPMAGAAMQMGTDAGAGYLSSPVLPFAPAMLESSMTESAAHSGARLPMQSLHPAAMTFPGRLAAQGTSQMNSGMGVIGLQGTHPACFPDSSYHQYFGQQYHNLQVPNQSQDATESGTSKETNLPDSSNG